MKQPDLTKPVMDRVVDFEKQQVFRWRIRYTLVISLLGLLGILFIIYTVIQINIDHTFDLFSLFTEDREVMSMFWQDTIVTFWNELPQLDIMIGFGVLLVIFGIIIATRRTRQKNRKKLAEIKKYQS